MQKRHKVLNGLKFPFLGDNGNVWDYREVMVVLNTTELYNLNG